MPKSQQHIHTEDELHCAETYFVYHVRMYAETARFLLKTPRPKGWDTIRNSVLESHLVHARILINFIMPKNQRPTDVTAYDFLPISQEGMQPLGYSEALKSYSATISSHLVHVTTKATPKLKSEQEWEVGHLARELLLLLLHFLYATDNKLEEERRQLCLGFIHGLAELDETQSVFAST